MTLKRLAPLAAFMVVLSMLGGPPHAAPTNTSNDSSYAFYEDALRYFKTKKYKATIIQLRNALRQDKRNLAARVLLGRAFLRLGAGAAAERQILTARISGADENLTIVPYGRALLLQGKNRKILDEILPANRPGNIEAEIRFLRGQAQLQQRDMNDAEASFNQALRIKPDHAGSVLGLGRLFQTLGLPDKAEPLVDRALTLAPRDADGWFTKGEIRRTRRDFLGALKNYKKAIDIADRHLPARISRAAVLVDLGRYDDAYLDVKYVLGLLRHDPQTNFLHAMILAKRGKAAQAGDALRIAANAMDERDPDFVINHPPSLLLRGVIGYAQRRFDEAYSYLSRYVDLVPNHPGSRKLLGSILLRKNEIPEAVKVLEKAVAAASDDIELLALLGNAYMRNRQYSKATELFQEAAEKAPGIESYRTRLALSRLAINERETGVRNLEESVRIGKRVGNADILLGMIRMQSGNYKETLALTETLKLKDPKNPFPFNLAGAAYMRQGNDEKAIAEFQQAIKLTPRYLPPRYNMAALEERRGNTEKAREIYARILALRPSEIRALFAISAIYEKQGNAKEAIKWLDQIRKRDIRSISAQIRLMNLYLRARRINDAMLVATDLENRYPRNVAVLEAKGAAQMAGGQNRRAIETFRQASYIAGNSARQITRIAKRQLSLKDFDGARTSLKAAISLDPAWLPAHSALIQIEARTGGIEKAMELAEAVQAAYPNSNVGEILKGDVEMSMKRYRRATTTYAKAIAKRESAGLIIRLYRARSKSGKIETALKDLERWHNKNPDDRRVTRVLATGYMAANQTARAIKLHEEILRDSPRDVTMLNNLALLYQRSGDPRALSTARQVFELAPSKPVVVDTYGWILVEQGQPEKGLPYLRDAQARSGDQVEVRYHISVALDKMGRHVEARNELFLVLQSGENFRDIARARALYKKIKDY
jgi:putative PEP-CTERM system TPR-repeat lipoprotein